LQELLAKVAAYSHARLNSALLWL